MATRNYHHARKQKEQARKARQQEKQQRRATRPDATGADGEAGAQDPTLAPGSATAVDGQPQSDTPAREEA